MSVSSKGKRKHIYNNETYYWFVRKNSEEMVIIHIEDDFDLQKIAILLSSVFPEQRIER